ncbi:hypothetical protein ACFSSA_04685 [Luteolibacter algae]|uniref:Uncharacterized protein n=1 Tax=Luteolibacter algae TaxID=454151 RepID=A0ABW5D5D7_9BACT
MMRIPGKGNEAVASSGPSTAEKNKNPGTSAVDPEAGATRKRKKIEPEAEVPDWDASAGKWRESKQHKKKTGNGLKVFAIISAVAVTLVSLFFVLGAGKDKTVKRSPDKGNQDSFEDLVGMASVPAQEDDSKEEDVIELPAMMKRNEAEFVKEAEPLAQKIYNAVTVEEILPLIFNAGNLEPKVREYYGDGEIEPEGLNKFNSGGNIAYDANFAAVSVLNKNYETRQIAFIDTEDGLKVDWESWVGWCEMPWEDFMEKRPTGPVLVRVQVKWVDYYNFEFADESQWRSYRLLSVDGETTLYGYVARNSPLDQRIRPSDASSVSMILKIHFPEGAESGNQVLISDFVEDGWVMKTAN